MPHADVGGTQQVLQMTQTPITNVQCHDVGGTRLMTQTLITNVQCHDVGRTHQVLQMTQTQITNVQSEQLLNMSTYASSVLHELSINVSVLHQRDIDTDS